MSSNKSTIKTLVSNSLKLEFKIICVRNEITISSMIEQLIEDLIEADTIIPSDLDLPQENTQVIKAYLPKDLKQNLKIFCVERHIPMNLAIFYLIKTKVEMDGE